MRTRAEISVKMPVFMRLSLKSLQRDVPTTLYCIFQKTAGRRERSEAARILRQIQGREQVYVTSFLRKSIGYYRLRRQLREPSQGLVKKPII